MKILHTESSNGFGGQEMRILRESIGLRDRGFEICMAVEKGGALVERARKEGFTVFEVEYKKSRGPLVVFELVQLIKKQAIDVVNTHSSLDSWLGGIAARAAGKKVVRTRHLSTPIRKGLNSKLLYNKLADFVVTTSSRIIPSIVHQSGIDSTQCALVATGVEPERLQVSSEQVQAFRKQLGLGADDYLVGTACVVRSWKGIPDLLQAAFLLRDIKQIHFVVIGGGYVDEYKDLVKGGNVHFVGHLEDPAPAIASLDAFCLLSTANEGISQASLQAAYLQKPLITTTVGGLPEVCRNKETGILVPPHAPTDVAAAVLSLYDEPEIGVALGENARALVERKFTMKHTLDQMQRVYATL